VLDINLNNDDVHRCSAEGQIKMQESAHLLPLVLKDELPLPPLPPAASSTLLPARWLHVVNSAMEIASARLSPSPYPPFCPAAHSRLH